MVNYHDLTFYTTTFALDYSFLCDLSGISSSYSAVSFAKQIVLVFTVKLNKSLINIMKKKIPLRAKTVCCRTPLIFFKRITICAIYFIQLNSV